MIPQLTVGVNEQAYPSGMEDRTGQDRFFDRCGNNFQVHLHTSFFVSLVIGTGFCTLNQVVTCLDCITTMWIKLKQQNKWFLKQQP